MYGGKIEKFKIVKQSRVRVTLVFLQVGSVVGLFHRQMDTEWGGGGVLNFPVPPGYL